MHCCYCCGGGPRPRHYMNHSGGTAGTRRSRDDHWRGCGRGGWPSRVAARGPARPHHRRLHHHRMKARTRRCVAEERHIRRGDGGGPAILPPPPRYPRRRTVMSRVVHPHHSHHCCWCCHPCKEGPRRLAAEGSETAKRRWGVPPRLCSSISSPLSFPLPPPRNQRRLWQWGGRQPTKLEHAPLCYCTNAVGSDGEEK